MVEVGGGEKVELRMSLIGDGSGDTSFKARLRHEAGGL